MVIWPPQKLHGKGQNDTATKQKIFCSEDFWDKSSGKIYKGISVLAVADVWGKASWWKKLSRARVWFSALFRECFILHNHLPCYRYFYVNLKSFLWNSKLQFQLCSGCFLWIDVSSIFVYFSSKFECGLVSLVQIAQFWLPLNSLNMVTTSRGLTT